MNIERFKNLITMKLFIFLSMSFLLYSDLVSSEPIMPHLVENIDLKIISYSKSKRKICEYKINKSKNLIYLDNENNIIKKIKIDDKIYYYNYLFNSSLEDDVYKFWLDKEVDLKVDGLYVEGKRILKDDDLEKIYLVEYLTLEKKIKIPLVIKSEYLTGDEKDREKLKVLSKEKKLKDIEYHVLYNFVSYINKIEKCY